ncbi:MAG: ribokinase [Lentisphaeria bacterium]|nr:ribokinase [Lentisphaeria bacterium]
MRVLNIGSLNIDIVYRVPHIVRPGETLSSFSAARHAGGKGLNQSVALARAGVEAAHAGAVGQDGLFLRELLEKEHVDCSGIEVLRDEPTGCAVIQVADDGENAIVLLHGANFAVTPERIRRALEKMPEGSVVLLQNEISSLKECMELAAKMNLRIFFNPSPMDKTIGALPLEAVDTFLVNEGEARALQTCAGERISRCNILTTLGARGAEYRGRNGEFVRVPAANAGKAVDTTGAGDTFTGYFVASLVQGEDPEAAMKRAAAAAAIAVTRPGAAESIPYLSEIIGNPDK